MPIQTNFPRWGEAHRGYLHERTRSHPLEKAFADRWEEENMIRPGRNHGAGLLQNLFFRGNQYFYELTHEVTPGERYVAATVIQWLGSNVGFSFLQSVLREEGLYITEIPKHGPLQTEKEIQGLYVRKFG